MRSGELIAVEEYFATSDDPDCDYVDGVVEERTVGEQDHSRAQLLLLTYFHQHEKSWNLREFPEQRVQVARKRFGIPDVCAVLGQAVAGAH